MCSQMTCIFNRVAILCVFTVFATWSTYARAETRKCEKTIVQKTRMGRVMEHAADSVKAAEVLKGEFDECPDVPADFWIAPKKQKNRRSKQSSLLKDVAKGLRLSGEIKYAARAYELHIVATKTSSEGNAIRKNLLEMAKSQSDSAIASYVFERFLARTKKLDSTLGKVLLELAEVQAKKDNLQLALKVYADYFTLAKKDNKIRQKGYEAMYRMAGTLSKDNDLALSVLSVYERYLEIVSNDKRLKVRGRNRKRAQVYLAMIDLAVGLRRTNPELGPELDVYDSYLKLYRKLATQEKNAVQDTIFIQVRKVLFEQAKALHKRPEAISTQTVTGPGAGDIVAVEPRATTGSDGGNETKTKKKIKQPKPPEPGIVTPVKIKPGKPRRNWPGIITGTGAGLLLAGLLVEGTLWTDGDNFDQRVAELCPRGCPLDGLPDEIDYRLSVSREKRYVAVGLSGAGVVLVAAGVVWWALRGPPEQNSQKSGPVEKPQDSPQKKITFVPLVSPRVIGGSWNVRF